MPIHRWLLIDTPIELNEWELTDALGAAASGVRIALVTGTTLANGAEAASRTVGVRSAREIGAGVVVRETVAAREAASAGRETAARTT